MDQRYTRNWTDNRGWHTVSWVVASVAWFAILFIPLLVLGWWAFAFPPWLIAVALSAPFYSAASSETGKILALIAPFLIWIALSVGLTSLGWKKRDFAFVSAGVHVAIPLIAGILAFWLAAEMNGGTLRGA